MKTSNPLELGIFFLPELLALIAVFLLTKNLEELSSLSSIPN